MQTTSKTYGTRQCANEKCGQQFEARRTNMIYCSNGCLRQGTNAKLIAQYHHKKNQKNIERKCKECSSKLSRYNSDEHCHACQIKLENNKRVKLLAELGIEYIDEDLL